MQTQGENKNIDKLPADFNPTNSRNNVDFYPKSDKSGIVLFLNLLIFI